jgi:arylsulfatase A-like enzyme
LIPHGPYAYDRECRLRLDVNSWLSNRPPFRRENSESEWQLSYAAYFEQLRCMQAKLQQLFDGLRAAGRFDDATIIVHGDHGSRIHRVAARAENLDRLEPRDYLDGFATLFAAKAPAMEAGYDEESAPVSRLLARAIGRSDLVREPDAAIQVYLEGKDDYDPWTPVPWQFSE